MKAALLAVLPYPLLRDREVARGRVVASVLDGVAGGVDEFELDRVLARRPAREPDGSPLVYVLRLAAVHRVAHAIVAAVTFKLRVREPEVDHYRVRVAALVLALRTAVGQERLRAVNSAAGALLRVVLALGRRDGRRGTFN